MSISRIDKMVCEILNGDSLEESAALRRIDIDLFLVPDETGKIAQMSAVAVALALRCLKGVVRIHFPSGCPSGLQWEKRALTDLLLHEAISYGEPERLVFNSREVGEWKIGLGVHVPNGFMADACGWCAGINQVFAPKSKCAAPSAVFATACAFAKLFCAAVLRQPMYRRESWSLNLAEFSSTPSANEEFHEPDSLGFVRLLGAGAIGSAFAYILWLSGWQATLEIIDNDYYDTPNEETSMVIGHAEARRNRKKALALAELVRRKGLETHSVVERVERGSSTLLLPSDAFVCAVDNAATRQLLDNVDSRLLVNGGVGGSAEDAGHIVWTRHLPGDPLISNRYATIAGDNSPKSVPKEFNDECSRILYRDAALAAPFVGVAVAALLAASCAHVADGRRTSINYLKVDLLKLQERFRAESWLVSGAKPASRC